MEIKDDYTLLKIRRLELKDSGEYTLRAYNGIVEVERKFQLVVKGMSGKCFSLPGLTDLSLMDLQVENVHRDYNISR